MRNNRQIHYGPRAGSRYVNCGPLYMQNECENRHSIIYNCNECAALVIVVSYDIVSDADCVLRSRTWFRADWTVRCACTWPYNHNRCARLTARTNGNFGFPSRDNLERLLRLSCLNGLKIRREFQVQSIANIEIDKTISLFPYQFYISARKYVCKRNISFKRLL